MSLWDKWEKEKKRKLGIEVEDSSDVEIHNSYVKPNIKRQFVIIAATIAICFGLVFAAMVFEAMYSGRRWSETYVVRLLVETHQRRENM